MNEQFKKLAIDAGALTFGGKLCIFGDADIEKFAELVVKQCANTVDEITGYDECNNTYPATGSDLLEHFGLK